RSARRVGPPRRFREYKSEAAPATGSSGRRRLVGSRFKGGHAPGRRPARRGPIGRIASGGLGAAPARLASHRLGETLDLPGVLGLQSTRLAILALDGLIHLLPVHGDLDRG